MECSYCKNKFTTKTNLNTHIKTAKYCLKIQGKDTSVFFKCDNCNTQFGQKSNFIRHQKICNVKKDEIQKLKKEIELIKKQQEIAVLKKEKEIYEKLHAEESACLQKIALQPKTSNTTNNNIVNNLAVYNLEQIKDKYATVLQNLEASDLYDGQNAVARLVGPCLKENNQRMISCTDYSRLIYTYKNDIGELQKDIKCFKLANEIIVF